MAEYSKEYSQIIASNLREIELLTEQKKFKEALAEIRDLEARRQIEDFTTEHGILCYLLSVVFQGLGRYEEALSESQKAFNILRNTTENEKVAQIHFLRGIVYSDLGDLKSSDSEFRDAVANYRRNDNKKGIIDSYNELARIYFIKSEYEKAVGYLNECLGYCDKMEDKKTKAKVSANLGRIYIRMGNWKVAESNLLTAMKIHEEIGNKVSFCNGLLSIGYVLCLRRKFEDATGFYEKALKLIYENNYMREMTIYYEYYGELAFAQGKYFLAKDHCKNGIKIGEYIAPDSGIISQTYRLLAEVQIAEKQYDEALSSCEKALKVATSLGEKIEIGAIHRALGQIYTALKQNEKAKESFDKSISILDQIGAKFELAKAYLEAGKSNGFDYFARLVQISRAEELFKELESEYHQGLVKLALAHLMYEHNGAERAQLFLNSAEKIFKELSEEKGLELVAEVSNKLRLRSTASFFPDKITFAHIISQDKKMLSVIEKARQIKDNLFTILLEGETGTGKDLLAQAIHNESRYKDKPFVPVNCAAIPKDLAESEFFGYKKGAFTGASTDKKGLIEEADGGTLFLNEITDLPILIQAKLLGAIEHKHITRLGDTKPIKVEFRVIVACNQDLKKEVELGNFRKDLYYRLSILKLFLPPLRERKNDIPLLVDHFLKKYFGDDEKNLLTTHPQILKIFEGHHWPGNVRELENEIVKFISLKMDENGNGLTNLENKFFSSEDFDKDNSSESVTLNERLNEYERNVILKSLKENRWVITKTARMLNIPETTLHFKIKKLNISRTPPSTS